MDWTTPGHQAGIVWTGSDRAGWNEEPEGRCSYRNLFDPMPRHARLPVPPEGRKVQDDELAVIRDAVVTAGTRWGMRIRVALGARIAVPVRRPDVVHRGRWKEAGPEFEGEPGSPGAALIAACEVPMGERIKVLHHELWHAWHDAPQWLPGEEDALDEYACQVSAAVPWWKGATYRAWMRSRVGGGEAGAVAYAQVATDGDAWPEGVAPGGAILTFLNRLAGK